MDERSVREMFYGRLAAAPDAEKAVAETYLALGTRIAAGIAAPRDDAAYWRAVSRALQLKTDLCRPEMFPGPADRDPVPIAGEYADAFLACLEHERALLEYFHDHADGLPPTPLKAKHDRASIARELERLGREHAGYARRCLVQEYALVPRVRFQALERAADAWIEALLGVQAYRRFSAEFNDALKILRALQAAQPGPAPAGPAN